MKRNIDRFPKDFMFELKAKEFENLRCQFGSLSSGGKRHMPMAFTEKGVEKRMVQKDSNQGEGELIKINQTTNKFKMNKEIILTGTEFYLKKETLKKVEVDKENWIIFYVDEINSEKWIEEYLFHEMQGGGFPQLRLLEKFPWE